MSLPDIPTVLAILEKAAFLWLGTAALIFIDTRILLPRTFARMERHARRRNERTASISPELLDARLAELQDIMAPDPLPADWYIGGALHALRWPIWMPRAAVMLVGLVWAALRERWTQSMKTPPAPSVWAPEVGEHAFDPDSDGWCVHCRGDAYDPLHVADGGQR